MVFLWMITSSKTTRPDATWKHFFRTAEKDKDYPLYTMSGLVRGCGEIWRMVGTEAKVSIAEGFGERMKQEWLNLDQSFLI